MNKTQRLLSLLFLLIGLQLQAEKKNVLLIPIDDLNDWIGVLGGHPQVKTPNIDALAAKGTLFTNAHCQSPVCNPSRASMMTSLYPETSGIYFLSPPIKSSPVSMKNTLLTQRYVDEGYYVAGAGKIMHGRENQTHIPNYAGSFGGFGPLPKKKIGPFVGHKLWDWGAFPEKDKDMPDFQTAAWGVNQLSKKHDKPFFLATGFFRPHVPQYAPQKWFDMYPLDEVQLPKVKADDLKNISKYATNLTRLEHVAPTQEWVSKSDQWKPLVQSYLACVSFVDAQVGKVVKALENSPYKDNTYIVLYSDHGFHLGEKERWAKRSLWEDGARVPMIIVGPGIKPRQVCNKPAQLLDIYPTLLELTGHKADSKLEGKSLVPLLKDPDADWPHMARTSFGPGNYAIISEQFRYIHYNDGSEEFYDHKKDPNEWDNQINNPEYLSVIKEHRNHKPKSFHKILGKGSTGHKSFTASEALK
ncbi:MAG: sulfatase [Lentisphaeraceae bacterium]|nr:sulfatase [Lentisphaeraceae bacterium]